MNNRSVLVSGVGINDADYTVTINETVSGRKKQVWVCPIYSTWKHVIERCYSREFQKRCPTYAGCEVVPEWKVFSGFRSWMMTQDYAGKQLDKDLLVPGNKIYGPDTCVFLPSEVNSFLTENKSSRGPWAVGVCWNKWRKKFHARCKNPFSGKTENLGYFDSEHEAHSAWKARKNELACEYASIEKTPIVARALRTRYANSYLTS
ncbi:hypothetical protein L4680_005102 [Pseudomonas aeruginosa]|nr:hypothetical protein [Pseudomonas aeruginosa]